MFPNVYEDADDYIYNTEEWVLKDKLFWAWDEAGISPTPPRISTTLFVMKKIRILHTPPNNYVKPNNAAWSLVTRASGRELIIIGSH